MATASEALLAKDSPSGKGAAAFIDRWIFVFTAGLFIIVVLTGFLPDSYIELDRVEQGKRLPFPLVLHMHAVLMGAFLLLLLTQTVLMATGRRQYHQTLGMAAMVLAPAIIVVGFVLVPTIYWQTWTLVHAPPPGFERAPPQAMQSAANGLLTQIRAGALFTILMALALRARARDSAMHKRLMILATLMPMGAAINRIGWLPTTLPDNPIATSLYLLLLILPLFAWDLYRQRRIHPAYVVAFAAYLPFQIAAQLLWNSPWWQSLVPRLMGVA